MKPLVIEGTPDTPYVCLDKNNNHFEICGASLPANIFEFYEPVLNWLGDYSASPNPETNLRLKFDYLNSSSTKMIHNIISSIEGLQHKGTKALVSWYYEFGDFEMKEMGEDFASGCNLTFKFIEKK